MPPQTGPRSLEQRVEIETPEQVAFEYAVAGVGSRAAAALIDYAICLLLFMLIFLIAAGGFSFRRLVTSGEFPDWVLAILYLALFAIQWGYYVLFEALGDGQTPGKRAMQLRVVQDGGYSISFAASAVRNIVRVVDAQPGIAYAVGIISVLLSKSGKRLGDIVAGTIVVQERTVAAPAAASDAPADAAPVSAALSDDEYSLLERFVQRQAALAAATRERFAAQLAERFGARLPNEAGDRLAALRVLYERERALRARGVAARSDQGAAREQHAIVATGSERWRAFAHALARARARGLKHLPEQEVTGFVSQYREIATDLARLRTAARGRDSDSVYYLSRLVAGGHNLLYRRRDLSAAPMLRYLLHEIPLEIRRSWLPIGLATAVFFGPMFVAHIAVERNPEMARDFISPGMIDRAETAVERARRGGGYLPEQRADDRGAGLASMLATNNVQVTFLAFALGITAGIGTVMILLINGVQIGGTTGLFAAYDVLRLIMAFITPHGVLELSAICISGGAGLLIGSAFLLPGALTRREALVVRGRRAITLIAGSTLFLIVAGLIEGYISPLHLPLPGAVAIGAATGLVALVNLFGARRRPPGETTDAAGAKAAPTATHAP